MSMPIFPFVITAFVLFGIGLSGAILRRNGLALLVSSQIAFSGCYLALAAFSAAHGETGVPTLLVVAVGAAQAVVTLAMVINMKHRRQSMDVAEANELKW